MRLLEMSYFVEYINTQNSVLKYIFLEEACPASIAAKAKVALENLREHLDRRGYNMPRPRYVYKHHDQRTWKYLPYEHNSGTTRLYHINPNFSMHVK